MKAHKVLFALILSTSVISSQPQWTQLNSNTNSLLIDLSFVSDDVGWVVGIGGTILKTTNAGADWIQLNAGTSADLQSVCFVDESNGFVGTENGAILKTTDGGITWNSTQIGSNTDGVRSFRFTDDRTGYAVVSQYTPYYYGYIFKTSDAGQSWVLKNTSYDYAYIDVFAYQEFAWVAGVGGIVAFSGDYGNSWNYYYTPVQYWLLDVFFTDSNTGWIVGGSDNNPAEVILKSTNGGITWQSQLFDYSFKALYGIYFIDSNTGWAIGNDGRILSTTNGGLDWIVQTSPVNDNLRKIQFPSVNTGYIVGNGGVILKYSGIPAPITILDPNGGETIAAGSNYYIEWSSTGVVEVKLDYSTDNGTHWISVADSVPSTGIYDWTVPNTLTSQGRIRITDITDSTVFDISDGPFTIQSSHSITVIKPNGGEELQGGSTYEIDWSSSNVENVKIECSINNGATWNSVVDSVQSSGAYIWNVPNVLTIQGKIKISDLSLPSVYDVNDAPFRINYASNAEDETNAIEYKLLQNYPNPFNPITTIEYSIPQKKLVTLKVFDVLGYEIATLVNQEKPGGNYTVKFDGSNLSSGIYFYQIKAGNYTDTKKLILMK